MKPLLRILALVAIILVNQGCGTTTDPVVYAETTTRVANDTMDAFVHLERNNEALIRKASPQIHQYANVIRRNGTQWLESARAMTVAYEQNRTPQNKANLDTALAVVDAAVKQSQQYIVQINATVGATGPVPTVSP